MSGGIKGSARPAARLLLQRAIAHGLIARGEVAHLLDGEPGGGGPPDSDRFGAELDALVRRGRLDAVTVRELEEEVASEPEASTAVARWPESPGGAPADSRPTAAGPPDAATPPTGELGPDLFEVDVEELARWERYEIRGRLGSGGMGQVFEAFDPVLKRPVAIKLLFRSDPDLIARFLAEARAQARVEHARVCKVYETGEVLGRPYIAMQLIRGESLARVGRTLTLEQKVLAMKEVAEAVQAAHRLGLIHRDLKPGNIMLEPTEAGGWTPYVLDFGLVRDQAVPAATATGLIVGTPAYMAPEQARGESHLLDRRTDVYGLGAVLYELLAGRPVFTGTTGVEVLLQTVADDPLPPRSANPRIPRDLETIILKCLEKEPGRRYDSARALAEDLQRFLEGDPPQARRAGWAYLLARKVRRHKAAAAVVALSLLVGAFLAAAGAQARWQARRQAALAQRFGQDAASLEGIMRFAALLPLHDTRREKEIVRARLAGIEKEMATLGALAEGPGSLAVGRAYLALHELPQAHEHLERAWRAGAHTPAAGYALGLTLATLYQQEMTPVAGIRSREVREVRRREIEATYREPALAYLHAAREGGDEAVPYAQGLIDLFENRYDHGLAAAAEALRRAPWLFEAKLLAGDIQMAEATARRDRGDADGAAAALTASDEAYRAAAAMAASDSRGYLGACRVHTSVMEAMLYGQGGDLAGELEQVRSWCGRALDADPEQASVHTTLAIAYRLASEQASGVGRDPRALLAEAEVSASRAIALAGRNAEAYRCLGSARRLRGAWEASHGIDPRPSLASAIEAYTMATEIDPSLATAFSNLGNADTDLGEYLASHGGDSADVLARAEASFERAIELRPEFAYAHICLGVAHLDHGEHEVAHGRDPLASLAAAEAALGRAIELQPKSNYALVNLGVALFERGQYELGHGKDAAVALHRAVDVFTRASEINPRLSATHNNLGNTYLTLAELEARRGGDARSDLEHAVASYRQALTINPKSASALNNLGHTLSTRGRYELRLGLDPTRSLESATRFLREALAVNPTYANACRNLAAAEAIAAGALLARGADPTPILRRARSSLARAEAIDPASAENARERGSVELLAARWAIVAKRPPEDAFAHAEDAFAAALRLNADDAESWRAAAELCMRRAAWRQQQGRSAGADVARGLELVAGALRIDPRLADALVIAGSLHLSAASAAPDAAERTASAARARALLEEAVRLCPLLAREVGPLLAQVGDVVP